MKGGKSGGMASLGSRLRKVEDAVRRDADVLPLADGTEIFLAPGDRLEALLAALDGESHPVHDHLDRIHPDADHDTREYVGLLKALGAGEGE